MDPQDQQAVGTERVAATAHAATGTACVDLAETAKPLPSSGPTFVEKNTGHSVGTSQL